ncbi:hypothetical protein Tsubulata_028362, partial [Turnera subulata]
PCHVGPTFFPLFFLFLLSPPFLFLPLFFLFSSLSPSAAAPSPTSFFSIIFLSSSPSSQLFPLLPLFLPPLLTPISFLPHLCESPPLPPTFSFFLFFFFLLLPPPPAALSLPPLTAAVLASIPLFSSRCAAALLPSASRRPVHLTCNTKGRRRRRVEHRWRGHCCSRRPDLRPVYLCS